MKKATSIIDDKVDFILTWVDGSDKEWKAEKAKYANEDKRDSKYRDWDLLKYWFRGVEKNAPWVNKVHFVTCGQIPEWLNTDCDKLHIVNHKDYIPAKFLPTFSSHPIELNFHRIKTLSEHFSYFNDDVFIISPVKKDDFFKDGLPRDRAILTVNCVKESWEIQHINNQDTSVINEYFDFKSCLKSNFGKWFNCLYGKENLRNIWLLPCPRFPGLKHDHINSNFLKSTYEEIWSKIPDRLNETSSHKFRTHLDVNQYLFKDWQIAKGAFKPAKRIGAFIDLKDPGALDAACSHVAKRKTKIVCINDAENIDEEAFARDKALLISAFEAILPEKSSFEK